MVLNPASASYLLTTYVTLSRLLNFCDSSSSFVKDEKNIIHLSEFLTRLNEVIQENHLE